MGDKFRRQPGKGYAEKAVQWRAKRNELGTEARRHRGTKARRETGNRRKVQTPK